MSKLTHILKNTTFWGEIVFCMGLLEFVSEVKEVLLPLLNL